MQEKNGLLLAGREVKGQIQTQKPARTAWLEGAGELSSPAMLPSPRGLQEAGSSGGEVPPGGPPSLLSLPPAPGGSGVSGGAEARYPWRGRRVVLLRYARLNPGPGHVTSSRLPVSAPWRRSRRRPGNGAVASGAPAARRLLLPARAAGLARLCSECGWAELKRLRRRRRNKRSESLGLPFPGSGRAPR